MIGLVLGGSQAASRSLLALIAPSENNAQFFGFFALSGKLAAAIGPLWFGIMRQIFSLRIAVLSLTLFFIVGYILLSFVKEPKIT